MSATHLVCNALRVNLGGREVLDGISERFAPGRVTVLAGPNGAGKSTLLACLAGLREPAAGVARLGDADVLQLPLRERARRIGFLPQTPEIHWDIDVATLVALGRIPHLGRGARGAADDAAIARAMEATDVSRFGARVARELSGGERARALLARLLAGEPEWLLADEPLANLDPAHQLDVLELLRASAARGAGVLVVMHDLSLAARVADDMLLLHEGRVLARGSGADVLSAANLRRAFGVEAFISDASGERIVVPLRRQRD